MRIGHARFGRRTYLVWIRWEDPALNYSSWSYTGGTLASKECWEWGLAMQDLGGVCTLYGGRRPHLEQDGEGVLCSNDVAAARKGVPSVQRWCRGPLWRCCSSCLHLNGVVSAAAVAGWWLHSDGSGSDQRCRIMNSKWDEKNLEFCSAHTLFCRP
jgi:hypothetical protein